MPELFSSTRWNESAPAIFLTGDYEIGVRTATTVQVRLKLTVGPVPNSTSTTGTFGYNIQAKANINGVDQGAFVTIKGNTPTTWTSNLTQYFPSASSWYTIDASALVTSLPARIYMQSNSGSARSRDFGGTMSFQQGLTNAYWNNGSAELSLTGIIPEDTPSMTVSWNGAQQEQGRTIYYRVVGYINGVSIGNIANDITSVSYNWTGLNTYDPGSSFYARVFCRDEAFDYPSSYVQTGTTTFNKMTGASITSAGGVVFETSYIVASRTNASNTNGDTRFTYSLASPAFTIYNGTGIGNPTTIVIYDGTGSAPLGPYINRSDVVGYLSTRNFNTNIPFNLVSTNAFGSSASITYNISFNYRKDPTDFSILSPTGGFFINSTLYYVSNQRQLTFIWSASTDPNNTTVVYDIETNVDGAGWSNRSTGQPSPSWSTGLISVNRTTPFQMRVTARTAYGTTRQVVYGGTVDLDYYSRPQLTNISVDRSDKFFTVSGTIRANTSIPNSLNTIFLQCLNDTVIKFSDTFSAPGVSEFNFLTDPPINAEETETYQLTVQIYDGFSYNYFYPGDPFVTAFVRVPRYAPLLTIREKGVGVNAVAGEYSDFVVNAAVTMYDTSGKGLIFSTADFIQYLYGLYIDADGEMRAASDLSIGAVVAHIETSTGGLQFRTGELTANYVKDEVVDHGDMDWTDFTTYATLADIEQAISELDLSKLDLIQTGGAGNLFLANDGTYKPVSGFNIDKVYPIGSIYISINSTNPNTYFGGTWTAWGTGRVPIAVDTSQSEFNTVQKTGGAMTHSHTSAAHTHDSGSLLARLNLSNASSRIYIDLIAGLSPSWTSNASMDTSGIQGTAGVGSVSRGTNVQGATDSTTPNDTGVTSSLMPYITCYMWLRTA